MIFLKLSKFSELLLIELRKTWRRYLQVLEMNSCVRNGGCNFGWLIGYHSLAMDILGMNDAIWNGTCLCFKL